MLFPFILDTTYVYRGLILMSKSIVILMQPAKLYPYIFQAL